MKFSASTLHTMAKENIAMEEVLDMVQQAAKYSKAEGFNRRFHGWLFQVEEDTVVRMAGLELRALPNPKGFTSHMVELHEQCSGLGCRDCNWRGEVVRYIP